MWRALILPWLFVAAGAQGAEPKLVLKTGQALAVAVKIEGGKVALGAARMGRYGELTPAEGEIAVGISPKDKDLYENVVVLEKTSAPVDFLASGMVGEIKIDERDIKGKLGETITQRIGATSWTVWLHEFEVGK
jgi:hypothetical protein